MFCYSMSAPKNVAIFLLRVYQKSTPLRERVYDLLGVHYAPGCTFYPSCSEYCEQAIEKYGLLKGLALGVKRIGRCHPWQKEHIDLP